MTETDGPDAARRADPTWVEDEGPRDLSTSELPSWSIADVPAGGEIQPVAAGNPSQLVCDGVLVHGRDGAGALHVSYRWPRKYWEGSLGISSYVHLVKHAVEARARSHGDVEIVDYYDTDDVVTHLEFTIHTDQTRLDRVLGAGLKIESELLEVPQAVELGIADSIAAARKRLDGWGTQPLDQLVDQMRDGNAHDKGVRLEELTSRLFQQVPGFTATGRVNTATEEIDIRIQNGSDHQTWRSETALMIAECKNWSGSCGRPEFSLFKDKIANRKGRVKCGFLVSWNGFADTVEKEMLRGSDNETLIVPVTGQDLRNAVRDDDFPALLLQRYHDAVFL
jgi:hypothetical protein